MYLRFGKGGTSEPAIEPLVLFDFETVGEGTMASPWTNQGTASFATTVAHVGGGAPDLRDTTTKHSGLASCVFVANNGEYFEYSGSAMDLGVHPYAQIKFYYYPTLEPTSFAHTPWGWGNDVDNRFFFAILPDMKPMVYLRRTSSTKFDIRSTVALSLNTWHEFILNMDGAGGVEFVVNDSTIGTGTDGDVDFSMASFGNARWGAEPWTLDNFVMGHIDDFSITVFPEE